MDGEDELPAIEQEALPSADEALVAMWVRSGPLPFPGGGRTLERWWMLSRCGAVDLAATKVYESHEDALAILAELERGAEPSGRWGVFAAEPPDAVLNACGNEFSPRLSGRKRWCSQASTVDFALVTCRDDQDRRRLAAVDLKHPGVVIRADRWAAAGMRDAATQTIEFADVGARFVGGPDAYVERRGFWLGAIGIAACWHGAASHLASELVERSRPLNNVHAMAHLGAVSSSLHASACALRDAAERADADSVPDIKALALSVRAVTVAAAENTLTRSHHALGAGPMCTDPGYARRIQDLDIFMLQSHAERDLEQIGRTLLGKSSEIKALLGL